MKSSAYAATQRIFIDDGIGVSMASTIITTGNGFTNSFILKGEKAVVIDTGIPGQEKKILATLRSNGIAYEDVSLIILTHGHGDHHGGLKRLKETLNVPVMAGWPDAAFIEKGDSAPVVPVNLQGRIIKLFTGFKPDPCKVDVIVKEDMDLGAYDIDARVLTTPGHTMGSISVLASDGGCAIGDNLSGLLMKNKVGMTPFAEAPDLIGPSIKKVIDSGATLFYPGHGGPWDKSAVIKKCAAIIK